MFQPLVLQLTEARVGWLLTFAVGALTLYFTFRLWRAERSARRTAHPIVYIAQTFHGLKLFVSNRGRSSARNAHIELTGGPTPLHPIHLTELEGHGERIMEAVGVAEKVRLSWDDDSGKRTTVTRTC